MKKSFIILFSIFYFLTSCSISKASSLFAGSAQQTVYQGQSFVVDWFLNTEGQNINALKINLNFSGDTLEALDLSTSNSLVSLWVTPPKISGNGQISLEGGIPGGLSGQSIPIFRSTFRAIKPGQGKITLNANSQILLNDGQGSPDKLSFTALDFPILPADSPALIAITSPTHPNQNAWYKNNKAVIKFSPKTGESYSYSFSSNLEIIPENQPQEIPNEITYNNLPDGIYYFKLSSKVSSGNSASASPGRDGWQEAAVYRVQIDTTPPEDFNATISSDTNIFGGQPFASFSTVDKTSGMQGYQIKTGLFGKFKPGSTPYLLRKPLIGDTINIQAADKAGNIRTITISYPGTLSVKLFVLLTLLLLIILLCVLIKKVFSFRNKIQPSIHE